MQPNFAKAIERRLPQVLDLARQLISFESTVGNEGPIVDFLAEYLTQAGLRAERVPVPEEIVGDPEYTAVPGHTGYAGRDNLVVSLHGGGDGRSLIINTHCDVVPGPSGLFRPRQEGDLIYGRGACDAKGQIATAVLALLALRDEDIRLRGQATLQIVIEEEAGGNGSLSLIRQGYRADAALVMEPTALRVHPANRGALWFRLEVKGRSVHMGKWYEGVNAIQEMTGLLATLRQYEDRLRAESRGHPLFPDDPSPVVVNFGTIRGGDWPASVAGDCIVEGGIAFLPNKRLADIRKEMREAIENEAGDWAKANYSLTFERLHNDAYETPTGDPAVQALCAAADEVRGPQPPTGFIASCDARLFALEGGMPTVVFGPGNLGFAHSKNEQVSSVEIAQAAEILARFVVDYCGRR